MSCSRPFKLPWQEKSQARIQNDYGAATSSILDSDFCILASDC
jgi:hypothetical protein